MEHTSNAKILIADENAAQRTQLRESLTRAGYRNVEEAVNGDDALHKIDRLHPDIAIIDIWLSKLDGIGVIRAAHNLDFRNDREPAYIITSPVSNQNMFIQAAGAGAQLCLIKPNDRTACRSTLRSCCGTGTVRRAEQTAIFRSWQLHRVTISRRR